MCAGFLGEKVKNVGSIALGIEFDRVILGTKWFSEGQVSVGRNEFPPHTGFAKGVAGAIANLDGRLPCLMVGNLETECVVLRTRKCTADARSVAHSRRTLGILNFGSVLIPRIRLRGHQKLPPR